MFTCKQKELAKLIVSKESSIVSRRLPDLSRMLHPSLLLDYKDEAFLLFFPLPTSVGSVFVLAREKQGDSTNRGEASSKHVWGGGGYIFKAVSATALPDTTFAESPLLIPDDDDDDDDDV